MLLCTALGFFGSQVSFLGVPAPAGFAFALSLADQYALSALAGVFFGALLFYPVDKQLFFVISILGAVIVKLIVAGKQIKNSSLLRSVAAFVLLFLPLLIKNRFLSLGTADLLFSVAESLIACALCYFFYYAFLGLYKIKNEREVSFVSYISLALSGLVFLCGLCGFEIAPFNLGRIAAIFFVILLSSSPAKTAAPFSICAAAALVICRANFLGSAFALAAGGLTASCFSRFGKGIRIFFFALIYAPFLLLGASSQWIYGLFDCGIGLVLSALFPKKWLYLFQKQQSRILSEPTESRRMASKLKFTAATLSEMQSAVEAISKKLCRSELSGFDALYDYCAKRVCKKCGLKLFCWETNYNQTMDAFRRVTPALKEKGTVDEKSLPPYFLNQCAKSSEIIQAANSGYREMISKEAARRKVLEAKQIAAEQFEGISQMLNEFGEELSEISKLDSEGAKQVGCMLEKLDEEVREIYCIRDRYDRYRIEIYASKPLRSDSHILVEELEELFGRSFDLPSVVSAKDLVKITFFEKARFSLSIGKYQQNASGNRLSGDSFETFTDSKGFCHLILSDGMGTGGRAAVDSIMTCGFVLKLLKSGFGFEAALKLINSALLVKAGGESTATLDIGCVDLYTGAMEFLKAGAPLSIIKRDHKTVSVSGSSLPIGILQGIAYDRHRFYLRKGDMVIMVTDGAVGEDAAALESFIRNLNTDSPKDMANQIGEYAAKKKESRDDITVLAAKLVEAE